jgi:hypothetical protein
MSNQLADHWRFRILNIVDDYSRFCPDRIVDVSISGARLACYLDELAEHHGPPQEIVLDNGPKGTKRAMFQWSERTGVRLRFIEPGRPSSRVSTAAYATSASTCIGSARCGTPVRRSLAGGITTTANARTPASATGRRSSTSPPRRRPSLVRALRRRSSPTRNQRIPDSSGRDPGRRRSMNLQSARPCSQSDGHDH